MTVTLVGVSLSTYQDLMDREVRKDGRNAVWQCHCPGCTDGDAKEDWSCTGYPDGRWYCFSCRSWGSVIDLAVRNDLGRYAPPGKLDPADTPLKTAYWKYITDPSFSSVVATMTNRDTQSHSGRDFTATERAFMGGVAQIMHRDLQKDERAQAYLAMRGAQVLECFGVARSRQMPRIHALARTFGEVDLPDRCGLTSKNPRYVGTMHFLLQDSVVAFNVVAEGVDYYQARTTRTDRDTRFYAPAGVSKRPIVFGSGPLVAAEGVFKVAWAVPYGFTGMAILGNAPERYPDRYFEPLNHQLYLTDRDQVKNGVCAGARAARIIQNRVDFLPMPNSRLHLRMPPAPFKDPDDWALAVGIESAAYQLHAVFDQIRASDPLFSC